MTRLLSFLTLAVLIATAYVISPFWAAWQLREAIRSGDTATLARKIEWTSVRASVRTSLGTQQDLAPMAAELGRQVRPTIWQRLKTAFGATMVDRFVETYITPEGLPQLASYGRTWNETVKRRPPDDTLAWHERLGRFYARVKRAEFTGLAQAVLEVTDKHDPNRSYLGQFELIGFEWKLTKLQIKTEKTAGRVARL